MSSDLNQSPDKELPVVLKEPIKEILIDGFSSALWSNDIVQLNLYRDLLPPNPEDSNERVLVGRLSMGISSLIAFHSGLSELIAELQKQGYVREKTEEQDETGISHEQSK